MNEEAITELVKHHLEMLLWTLHPLESGLKSCASEFWRLGLTSFYPEAICCFSEEDKLVLEL